VLIPNSTARAADSVCGNCQMRLTMAESFQSHLIVLKQLYCSSWQIPSALLPSSMPFHCLSHLFYSWGALSFLSLNHNPQHRSFLWLAIGLPLYFHGPSHIPSHHLSLHITLLMNSSHNTSVHSIVLSLSSSVFAVGTHITIICVSLFVCVMMWYLSSLWKWKLQEENIFFSSCSLLCYKT
jgi:hypothetical protein